MQSALHWGGSDPTCTPGRIGLRMSPTRDNISYITFYVIYIYILFNVILIQISKSWVKMGWAGSDPPCTGQGSSTHGGSWGRVNRPRVRGKTGPPDAPAPAHCHPNARRKNFRSSVLSHSIFPSDSLSLSFLTLRFYFFHKPIHP